MQNIFKLIFVFLALSGVVDSAKILIVFNAVSKSHHILGDALAIGLAEKGHEVKLYIYIIIINNKLLCY